MNPPTDRLDLSENPAPNKYPKVQVSALAKIVLTQFEKDLNHYLEELKRLVRIAGVSFPGFDQNLVVKSGQAVADLFKRSGIENVKLLYGRDNPRPYVYGDWLHAPGAPTLLLYAHHDVQPPGRTEKWKTQPFEPTLCEDGRLYGRGAADDKAGVLVHVATIASFLKATGKLPVNVKLLIEGEEEIGSPGLEDFLKDHKDLLKADIMVLTDTDNYSVDRPGLTVALRGIVGLNIEMKSLKAPIHSGMWGGPVPDAAMGLSKVLASLVNEKGEIQIPGLEEDVVPLRPNQVKQLRELSESAQEIRRQAGLLDGVNLLPSSLGIKERIWFKPSLTVNAIEASSRKQAANIIVDSAWAKVTVRTVPNMKTRRVYETVKSYIEAQTPFGLKVEVSEESLGGWWRTETEHPVFNKIAESMEMAWGVKPVFMGCGGSIGFVQPFSDALGGVPAVLIGVEDPSTAAHSENESLHLGVFEKSIKSCIYFYDNLKPS